MNRSRKLIRGYVLNHCLKKEQNLDWYMWLIHEDGAKGGESVHF